MALGRLCCDSACDELCRMSSSAASAVAPLLTRAGFGALDGAASVAELVERARAAGMLSVTDNSTSCVRVVLTR